MADWNEYQSDENLEDTYPKKSKASPRPRSATKRSKSTSNRRPGSAHKRSASASASLNGHTARELWLSAVGTGKERNRGYAGNKSSTEYWSDTLRRTGVGISTESRGSFSGLKKSQTGNMAYSSTSHYLRQVAGTESRNRKMAPDMTSKLAPGTPAYKTPEEYYDDIIVLKKQMQAVITENNTLKSKVRRLEEDNLKKERQIEQLLDPSKSDEMRRTMGDRKADTGAVMHGLKQKILKLEHQLKDKETAYNKLQSDLKTTKIEEMRIQMESFYKEVVRLSQLKSTGLETQSVQRKSGSGSTIKESPSRLKALQETIMRMNEKNVRLQNENKTLKQDLQQMMDQKETAKERHREYEDMSKKELMSTLTRLEKRLDRAEMDTQSITSDIDSRHGATQGKIVLEGTVAQKLDQLDKRETELLEELSKKQALNKRLKDDRAYYRKKSDEKDLEIKRLKKEVDELQAELDGFYDKSRTPRTTPRRPSTPQSAKAKSRRASAASMDREQRRRVEEFRQQTAAKHIQKGWRDHRSRVEEDEARKLQDAKVNTFTEAHAARTIQGSWRDYRQGEEAAEVIQSAMRGHKSRQRNLERMRGYYDTAATESETDEAADLLQSSFRGHKYRQESMRSSSKEMAAIREDDSDLEEAAATLQAAFRGHLDRKYLLEADAYSSKTKAAVHVESDSDFDEAAATLQAAFRGHIDRKHLLESETYRSKSPRSRSPRQTLTRASYSTKYLDSAGEEEDTDELYSSKTRKSGRSSPKGRPPSAYKKSRTPPARHHDDDYDDDESDIMMPKGKKFF